ncbi:hypothetical protein [Actinokineospora iranica]|uniref:hypothetical protein n=1 Tax=Actinokineospora iranica TaxID=1271860 RepID=UPI000B84724A|nr:hypothetical protein [Actinokineospora iranica]
MELQPADTYEARDPSGFIIVTVDKYRMMRNARIRPGWDDNIRPEDFPAALLTTYVTAVQRAFAVEYAHRPTDAPSTPVSGETFVDPTDLSFDEWMARTKTRLDAIDAEYDAIQRQQQAPRMDFAEIRSPLGYLTMRLRGGEPIAINGDPMALDNPSDTVLSEEILQLFVRAGLGVDQEERPRPARASDNDADSDYFSEFTVLRDRGEE